MSMVLDARTVFMMELGVAGQARGLERFMFEEGLGRGKEVGHKMGTPSLLVKR
jgi:hypothetical protein